MYQPRVKFVTTPGRSTHAAFWYFLDPKKECMAQRIEQAHGTIGQVAENSPPAEFDNLPMPHLVHNPDNPWAFTIDEVHETYGSDGIAMRTELTLQQYELSNNEQVRKAQRLANALHVTDKRSDGYRGKEARHIDHVNRIVLGLLESGVRDADTITAAFLHDAGIEDHAWEMALLHPDFHSSSDQPPKREFPQDIPISPKEQTVNQQEEIRQLAYESIQYHFPDQADPDGPSVADMVLALSNPIVQPGENKLESYNDHLAVIDKAHPKVRAVKAEDVGDNAGRNRYTSNTPKKGERAGRQLKGDVKYERAFSYAINWLRARDSLVPEQFQGHKEQEMQMRSSEAAERRKAAGRAALTEVRHSLYANTARTKIEQGISSTSKYISRLAMNAHIALYLPRTDSKDTG